VTPFGEGRDKSGSFGRERIISNGADEVKKLICYFLEMSVLFFKKFLSICTIPAADLTLSVS